MIRHGHPVLIPWSFHSHPHGLPDTTSNVEAGCNALSVPTSGTKSWMRPYWTRRSPETQRVERRIARVDTSCTKSLRQDPPGPLYEELKSWPQWKGICEAVKKLSNLFLSVCVLFISFSIQDLLSSHARMVRLVGSAWGFEGTLGSSLWTYANFGSSQRLLKIFLVMAVAAITWRCQELCHG